MPHRVIDFFHLQSVVLHDGAVGDRIEFVNEQWLEETYLSSALAYFSRSLLAISDIYREGLPIIHDQRLRTNLH